MQRFLIASGMLFSFVAVAWLCRLLLAVPITVNGYQVPVWLSVVPMFITGSLAVWAFRLASSASA